MRREFSQPAAWAAGLLVLSLISGCGGTPSTITEATQSQQTIRPGELVRFDVRYSTDDASRARLTWKTNFGQRAGESGTTTGGTVGMQFVHFRAPGCLRDGLTPTITVTLEGSSDPGATRSFSLTPLEFQPCTWTPPGPMGVHSQGQLVVLPSGKVMMAGGDSTLVELYEPGTQQWTVVAPMLEPRMAFALVTLPSGKVLAAGGRTGLGARLASAELYDPATNTWAPTGSMTRSGFEASAIVLPSGKVLLTSDFGSEVYDPATGTWAATPGAGGGVGPLVQVSSGAVLKVTDGLASVQLYDHRTEAWSSGQAMKKTRWSCAVTPLFGGKLLVTGGDAEASAELYDPVTGWSSTGNMLQPRYGHSATRLPSGQVLVTGGSSDREGFKPLSTSELYDPLTGTWSPAGAMEQFRKGHHAALLPSGEVLVVGDGTFELYRP